MYSYDACGRAGPAIQTIIPLDAQDDPVRGLN